MAAEPAVRPPADPDIACALEPFRDCEAARVCSWISNEREAWRLAPRTRPPLTPAHVLRWGGPNHEQWLLRDGDGSARAYGEVNLLNGMSASYWLGHLLVDPARRGTGLGCRLTRALLRRAFLGLQARHVSLVVFTDNAAAVTCYQRAGLRHEGYEFHRLRRGRTRLLRMGLSRAAYDRHTGLTPAESPGQPI